MLTSSTDALESADRGTNESGDPRRPRQSDIASNRISLFVLFLAVSLILRASTFGHPNMDSDEAFYFLVGQEMHHGALPYVDLWDRKPFGLFALFYLFAFFGSSVLTYQIPAALFVAGTSWFIGEIAALLGSSRAGIFGGLIYPLQLPLFFGWGGQAPVFYNLPMAAAAYLVLRSLPALRSGQVPPSSYAAMALCGLTITIKQTALFEACFFGLCGLAHLSRSELPRRSLVGVAATWMSLGAVPSGMLAAAYGWAGHWSEFWQAMATSNFAKKPASAITLAARARDLYFRVGPLVAAVVLGVPLGWKDRSGNEATRFLVGWLAAATVGFLVVPNFYPHYALPLLVPFSIAAGLFFSRGWMGLVGFAVVAGYAAWSINFFDWRYTRQAQQQLGSMAQAISEYGGERGLLVFDGPILLYQMVGQRPPSPLALPLHLNYAAEEDVSHLRTNAELARILAASPGAVTVPLYARNSPRNEQAFAMVLAYVQRRCRLIDIENSSEMFRSDPILVYGGCR
jgi:hypothetical protein